MRWSAHEAGSVRGRGPPGTGLNVCGRCPPAWGPPTKTKIQDHAFDIGPPREYHGHVATTSGDSATLQCMWSETGAAKRWPKVDAVEMTDTGCGSPSDICMSSVGLLRTSISVCWHGDVMRPGSRERRARTADELVVFQRKIRSKLAERGCGLDRLRCGGSGPYHPIHETSGIVASQCRAPRG